MPKRDRYEHLTLAEALKVLAEEGNVTKDETEILCQIAEKIDEEFSSTFVFSLPKPPEPPKDAELWADMVSLIKDSEYQEARTFIEKHRPIWRDHCEVHISAHQKADTTGPKEESFAEICRLLNLEDLTLGRGSTVRKSFYNHVIEALDLGQIKKSLDDPPRTKQQLAKFIIDQAGLGAEWSDTYSSAGGTVTADGLELVLRAVQKFESE